MPLSRSLPAAALAAAIAAGVVVSEPAQAQRHGGGGRPVAASPGAKPSMGNHWSGNPGSGRWDGRWSGRGDGRWDGHWNGRGDGRWDGRWHGNRHFYYPRYAVGFGLGLGLGLGWPYWGWGYDYPYYGFVRYPYSYAAPVGIVEGPVYEPAPAGAGESSFRWYCPSASAYYPDVRECSRAWMKVVPSERGSAPPPVTQEAPSPPSGTAPRSSAPAVEPYPASTYRMRAAAPRMRGPAHEVYSQYATP